jgi:hypothetical protein
MSPNLNWSITKSLIFCDKWATNADSSPIFKSPWTFIPSWLTWFHWMKHNFDTCLSKYNVLMVNSTLHPFFIKPPHFFPKFMYPCCLPLMGLLFIDIHFCWNYIMVLCNIFHNICEIIGTILTLILTKNQQPI